MAVAVHLLAVPALLSLGYQAVRTRDATLTAVNLSPPPPAPPPQEAQSDTPQPQPLQTQVAIPQPLIPSPVPVPVVPVVVTSAPQAPFQTVAAPPAPSSAQPAPAAPSTVTSDALGTRMLSGEPPRYPLESRRKKEQGTVELLLILGLDGRVETISVARSSGFVRLDQAALSAVKRWRWASTLRDGIPVKVRGVVEIPFVLTTG